LDESELTDLIEVAERHWQTTETNEWAETFI
jgi:hypothetical protein